MTRSLQAALAAAALLVTALVPLPLAAQAQKFDTASIRPCRPEEAPPGPARGGAGGTNATFSAGRMNVPCATLETRRGSRGAAT